MSKKPSIVILGAGFGGIACAIDCAKRRHAVDEASITVVDRERHHLFTPLLYEAATGFFDHENLASTRALERGCTVDTKELFAPWGIGFVQGDVASVDWERREVVLRQGDRLRFDYLVIALGAETSYFDIPGMEEHAVTFKSARDAERVRQRVQDLLYRREIGKEKKISIMIGGAGASGLELAGEMALFLRRQMIAGTLEPEDFQVSIVEARNRVLPAFDELVSAWAKRRLEDLGVKVYVDTCVKRLDRTEVTLAPRPLKKGETVDQLLCDFRKESEKVLEADVFVWTGGIRGSSSLESLGIPLDDIGHRIRIGASLEVVGHDGTYAIGDSVVLMDPRTNRPVTWLAQAAMEQGRTVACSIMTCVRGGSCTLFRFRGYPSVITVGGKWAIAQVGTWKARGLLGWLVREAADLRYFLSILPFGRALALWWRGLTVFTRND
jgi:NADH dehydrogenase